MTGHELLEEAVKAGGKKLDSFDGNFAFYLRNGFEPVSWTAFDENYAPKGWEKGKNDPEPVIFFKSQKKNMANKTKIFGKSKRLSFTRK